MRPFVFTASISPIFACPPWPTPPTLYCRRPSTRSPSIRPCQCLPYASRRLANSPQGARRSQAAAQREKSKAIKFFDDFKRLENFLAGGNRASARPPARRFRSVYWPPRRVPTAHRRLRPIPPPTQAARRARRALPPPASFAWLLAKVTPTRHRLFESNAFQLPLGHRLPDVRVG